MENKEYVEYLTTIDDDIIQKAIEKYHKSLITFEKLEIIAISQLQYSKKVYEKCFKLGNILRG